MYEKFFSENVHDLRKSVVIFASIFRLCKVTFFFKNEKSNLSTICF